MLRKPWQESCVGSPGRARARCRDTVWCCACGAERARRRPAASWARVLPLCRHRSLCPQRCVHSCRLYTCSSSSYKKPVSVGRHGAAPGERQRKSAAGGPRHAMKLDGRPEGLGGRVSGRVEQAVATREGKGQQRHSSAQGTRAEHTDTKGHWEASRRSWGEQKRRRLGGEAEAGCGEAATGSA